jgi:1-phosphofructokinase family hexose kinase
MIVTVTLNPALDRTLEVPGFAVGRHAKARLVALIPAGKGVNLARGFAALGAQATACGLVGEGEKEAYRRSLEADGVACALTPIQGITRTNTTILDPQSGTTTHLREQGFLVAEGDMQRLRGRLAALLGGGGVTVAFSGSLPPGVGAEAFASLLVQCAEAAATVVVDSSGDALCAAVGTGRVHTIKPNLLELGQCLGAQVQQDEAPARAAELLDKVDTVLLTLGEQGAYAVRADGAVGMACRVDESRIRNVVGCGDAFLAGWLYGVEQGGSVEDALRWAVACGAASAMTDTTAGYTREDVEAMRRLCEPM